MGPREKLLAAANAVSSVLREARDADSTEDAALICHRLSGTVLSAHLQTLAFEPLQLRDQLRFPTLDQLLSPEFVTLSLSHIGRRGSNWEYLLVMLGNMSSTGPVEGEALVLDRLVEADDLVPLLLELAQTCETANMPTGTPVRSTAVWIAANLASGVSKAAKQRLYPMADVLLNRLSILRKEIDGPDCRPPQEYMKTFRTLCCLLPGSDARLHADPCVVKWLLEEYTVALEGKSIPGSNLYPDPEDRAQTLAQLCTDDWGLNAVVEYGGLGVLVKSLGMRHNKGVERTGLLWERAVRCIHLLASSVEHREALQLCGEAVKNLQSVCSQSRSEIQVSARTRKLAVDAVIALSLRWDVERLLWLGLERNDPVSCPLARLSHSMMRTIMVHFLWHDADSACDFEVVPTHAYVIE